jgi:hypothetical protein
MVNVQSASAVCGVGSAESTGKPSVTYWPGGTRSLDPDVALRRPLKPRETGLTLSSPVGGADFSFTGTPARPHRQA